MFRGKFRSRKQSYQNNEVKPKKSRHLQTEKQPMAVATGVREFPAVSKGRARHTAVSKGRAKHTAVSKERAKHTSWIKGMKESMELRRHAQHQNLNLRKQSAEQGPTRAREKKKMMSIASLDATADSLLQVLFSKCSVYFVSYRH